MTLIESDLGNNNNNDNELFSPEFNIKDLIKNQQLKPDKNEEDILPKRHNSTLLFKSVRLRSRNKKSLLISFQERFQDSTNDNYSKKTNTNKTRTKNIKSFSQINKNKDSFMEKVKHYIHIKNRLINENDKNKDNYEVFRKGKTMDIINDLYITKKNINDSTNKNNIYNMKKKNWNERNYIEEYYKRELNSSIYKSFMDKSLTKSINKKEDNANNSIKNKSQKNSNKEQSQRYLYNLKSYMEFYYEKNAPFIRNNNSPFTKLKSSTIDNSNQIIKEKNLKTNISMNKIYEKTRNKSNINNKKNNKIRNNYNNYKNRTKNEKKWNKNKNSNFNQSINNAIIFNYQRLFNKNIKDSCFYLNRIRIKPKYNNNIFNL